MTAGTSIETAERRELGNGLVLRWSTPADVERVVELDSTAFRDAPDDPLNQPFAAWVRDMFSGRHPLVGPYDFALVEDEARGLIVASACLMRQTITYDGIPLKMGRTEAVATLPEYRNRGLIRAIFGLLHTRSEARGDIIQGITGINYFYRQFGYEYALDLGGGRRLSFDTIPPLKEGEAEPYRLRPATPDDIATVMALYARDCGRVGISTVIETDVWRWLMTGMGEGAMEDWTTDLIVGTEERVVGYVLFPPGRWGRDVPVRGLTVVPGVSLAAVLPSVLRAARDCGPSMRTFKPDTPPPAQVGLYLGRAHPAYDVLNDVLTPPEAHPYAWYIRVPDLPRLVRELAPVLERRLASSALAGHTGEIAIEFYRGGLRLAFEQGRLTTAEDWSRGMWGKAQAGFPPLVFLQLLFGHRSLAQLRDAYPDVYAEDPARLLLEALFPRTPAWVVALD